VLAGNRGSSICQNAKTAFSRAADTAGTSAHIIYGENISVSIGRIFLILLRNGKGI
jgi:hypothetical protein